MNLLYVIILLRLCVLYESLFVTHLGKYPNSICPRYKDDTSYSISIAPCIDEQFTICIYRKPDRNKIEIYNNKSNKSFIIRNEYDIDDYLFYYPLFCYKYNIYGVNDDGIYIVNLISGSSWKQNKFNITTLIEDSGIDTYDIYSINNNNLKFEIKYSDDNVKYYNYITIFTNYIRVTDNIQLIDMKLRGKIKSNLVLSHNGEIILKNNIRNNDNGDEKKDMNYFLYIIVVILPSVIITCILYIINKISFCIFPSSVEY
jgi:hypothetical protein